MRTAIINTFKYFKPNDFKGDVYGWQTNQISHLAMSLGLTYIFGLPLLWCLLWITWELIHLIISKNIVDFFEDLIFELGGIYIILMTQLSLLWGKFSIVTMLIVFFVLTIIKKRR